MTDARARRMFDDTEDAIDTVHVIYPEDCYVPADIIIGWAHDAMVNAAVDDYVKLHGVFADDPAGTQAYEILAASVQRPDLEGAIEFLSDVGSHTFARDRITNGMVLNRMQDVPALRALGRKCFPKQQHDTRGAAEAQMRSILKLNLAKDATRIHVYECPHCGCFHVGHERQS